MKTLAFVLFAALALAPTSDSTVRSGKPAASCAGVSDVGTGTLAYVGVARGHTVAFRSPGEHSFASFERLNVNGVRTVFSIRQAVFNHQCRPAWYRVQLPVRPNGAVGYVRASAVVVGSVTTRIVVDLSARRLTYYRAERPRLRVHVSIGSQGTPTPVGRYYVNQRLKAADPQGAFGPSALGISAFSPVLTGWTQGGPIAVHGTNRPDLIGRAVSSGCIRVSNAVMRRLFPITPVGTPVEIRA